MGVKAKEVSAWRVTMPDGAEQTVKARKPQQTVQEIMKERALVRQALSNDAVVNKFWMHKPVELWNPWI